MYINSVIIQANKTDKTNYNLHNINTLHNNSDTFVIFKKIQKFYRIHISYTNNEVCCIVIILLYFLKSYDDHSTTADVVSQMRYRISFAIIWDFFFFEWMKNEATELLWSLFLRENCTIFARIFARIIKSSSRNNPMENF